SFLNAFPLILDDSNTADNTNELQQFIYMFGNGTGKMRGSVDGSRNTNTWKSILITSGENNILEYTDAQGAAGRVIPITHIKIQNKSSDFFNKLNKSVEEYYGVIGLEFIKRWNRNKEKFKGWFDYILDEYQSMVN